MEPSKPRPKSEFFRTNILVHTHVEKAAGTTLVDGMTMSLGKEHVCDLRGHQDRHPSKLTPQERAKIHLLTGHFHFGKMDQFIVRKKLYFATVRPPFSRFRSYINYIGEDHPGYKYVANKTFPEIIDFYLGKKMPSAHNPMSRMLSGMNSPSEKSLFQTIEDRYLFVAPYKRVNEALDALISLVGSPSVETQLHQNKARGSRFEESGELEKAFMKVNQLDQALYDHAEKHFDGWLKSLPERVARIREVQEREPKPKRQPIQRGQDN